ncbi:MAG: hypothetical protein KJ767_02825, partial [Nanoarchaeota archaeon]|nr:hypothetical protein [Nanoarchaeota archaeon]
MKKIVLRIFGILFLVIGIAFLFNSFPGLTGFVIIEKSGEKISNILGLIFIVISILLFISSQEHKNLEKIVLISKQAREKNEKDARIKQNMKRYVDEIRMIQADPTHRPQEIIGQFHVSPRSKAKGGIRIAWHRRIDEEQGKEIIYIDD